MTTHRISLAARSMLGYLSIASALGALALSVFIATMPRQQRQPGRPQERSLSAGADYRPYMPGFFSRLDNGVSSSFPAWQGEEAPVVLPSSKSSVIMFEPPQWIPVPPFRPDTSEDH